MERTSNEHLQPQQIAELYEGAVHDATSPLNPADLHPHLRDCALCRERFEQCFKLDDQLRSLAAGAAGDRQPDCPDPAIWPAIVSGVMETEKALPQIQHASGCEYCGKLLHESVADLHGETTPSERAILASLASSEHHWRQQLAQRISGTATDRHTGKKSSPWRRWITIPRLAVVVAAAALVGIGVWQSQKAEGIAHVDRLLAQAYSERRTLELRVPGASYAPPRVQLGPDGSFLARPTALLKAEALIAQGLDAHPADPSWLQAKARADLLEGRYDPAIETLRRALQLSPNSPGALTDLGAAYFQRAQTGGRTEDLGAAFEQLSRSLTLQPDDPVALFNRAIVAEHQFLYRQALDDWDRYLKLDSTGDWAAEARKRADALRAKLKQNQSRAPLLSPAGLTARSGDPNVWSEVEQRDEEYLDLAVSSWLPEAYPESHVSSDPGARPALFFLAQLTAQQHGDSWLSDLLRGESSTNFAPAVAALSRAVQANAANVFDAAELQAEIARKTFHASGNLAGELRAEFEAALAAQLNRQSEDCRARAISALTKSERFPYVWLRIQLRLESAVCSGLMGDLEADLRMSKQALELSQQSGYHNLYLRSAGFVAGDQFEFGDLRAGWKSADACFDRFWSQNAIPLRGYNCYTFLAGGAYVANWPHLQLAALDDGIALIDKDREPLFRAAAHLAAGNSATEANQPAIAARHYAEAARLYALAPPGLATRSHRIEASIRAAQLEARENKIERALDHLTGVQSELPALSDDYLAQMFYSTLGEVQLRRRRAAEAESAFRAALKLSERNLQQMDKEADQIKWIKNAAPVYLGLAEAELLQGRQQDSLAAFEWYLASSQWNARKLARGGEKAEPLPSWLDSRLPLLSDETILACAPLPDGIAVWLFDNRGITTGWIPAASDHAEELADRLYSLSSDPTSEIGAFRRDSRALYSLLIAPVEKRIDPQRTLVIETDGWTSRVPFELLLDSNQHYLVERAPIVYSQGLRASERLRRDGGLSTDSAALIVASTSAPRGSFPPPGVREQAEAVSANFRRPRLLVSPEATLPAVREALRTAEVFNYAGHSVAAPGSPGLTMDDKDPQTGNPGLLDAAVLRTLPMPRLQLAVLSACSTADSRDRDENGFESLADALLRASVPHVVASRWPVDAIQTRGYMEEFYRNLLSGVRVPEAVRQTSRRMLADPRTAHPYYWAAFAAYGRQ